MPATHKRSLLKDPERVSVERYLREENERDSKHEYYGGAVVAMAGATEQHEIVAGNLFLLIGMHLKGKRCRVFKSDMKLRVVSEDKTLFYYPDIMVTCSQKDKNEIYKEHPTLIIEVASQDWKRYYLEKLAAYLPLKSLQEYVVVWPDLKNSSVSIYRPAQGLHPAEVHKKGHFTLQSIGLTVEMKDLFV